MSEDPKFRSVSGPDSFPSSTQAAVTYIPVMLRGSLAGYVWAAVTDDAVGYVERESLGDDAFNAGVEWVTRFRWAKANGLTPRQVLRHWAGQPEDGEAGYVPPDSENRAASLDSLRALGREPGVR